MAGRSKKGDDDGDRLTRIAIVNEDKCKPKKCGLECKKNCPVVRLGKLCIEVTSQSRVSWISEELCIGCGLCAKKCPFEAIQIINLPKDLARDTTHRYGPNSFKLHRLPMPRPGQVLGLVGTNGIGKSTALKVLAGKLKPNLGRFENPPTWAEILQHYRGSELQNFFSRVLEEDIKAVVKPQYVDHLPRVVKGTVGVILEKRDERKVYTQLIDELDLHNVLERKVADLSGGELQRFAIAIVCIQHADVYMFDEPSSYLDVRQRLKAAQTIRGLSLTTNYTIVVEHDLSVLDYLSDFVCVLYGKPGAYGVVTMPFSVREGINIFLAGFVPTENLRFRQVALSFRVSENLDVVEKRHHSYSYPHMKKNLGAAFNLEVEPGTFTESEIIVMLGQNGTGKTTFIRMMANLEGYQPDIADGDMMPSLSISYKPQKIAAQFDGTVRELLHKKIRSMYTHPQFNTDVMRPLNIEDLIDQEVKNLSGGELQRVAITLALGKPADIYLIDEPSAYLDSEQRIIASKVIKRFILHSKKTAFVVEHDFIMATYLADRVIVYTGQPARNCVAHTPQSLVTGMNSFLKDLEITFRRDPTNYRPRINKYGSVKDQEQKKAGTYFYLDEDDDDDDDKNSSKDSSGGSGSAAPGKSKGSSGGSAMSSAPKKSGKVNAAGKDKADAAKAAMKKKVVVEDDIDFDNLVDLDGNHKLRRAKEGKEGSDSEDEEDNKRKAAAAAKKKAAAGDKKADKKASAGSGAGGEKKKTPASGGAGAGAGGAGVGAAKKEKPDKKAEKAPTGGAGGKKEKGGDDENSNSTAPSSKAKPAGGRSGDKQPKKKEEPAPKVAKPKKKKAAEDDD